LFFFVLEEGVAHHVLVEAAKIKTVFRLRRSEY